METTQNLNFCTMKMTFVSIDVVGVNWIKLFNFMRPDCSQVMKRIIVERSSIFLTACYGSTLGSNPDIPQKS